MTSKAAPTRYEQRVKLTTCLVLAKFLYKIGHGKAADELMKVADMIEKWLKDYDPN